MGTFSHESSPWPFLIVGLTMLGFGVVAEVFPEKVQALHLRDAPPSRHGPRWLRRYTDYRRFFIDRPDFIGYLRFMRVFVILMGAFFVWSSILLIRGP